MFAIWPMLMCVSGCETVQITNATACEVGFDYKDKGVNNQNARALLVHYCICHDNKLCK